MSSERDMLRFVTMYHKDLQKQIDQLKGLVGIDYSGNDNPEVVECSTGGVGFNAGEICKIIEGTGTAPYLSKAVEIDGTETTDSSLIPGIVINGNSENTSLSIFVLIGGVGYLMKDAASIAVVDGDKLYFPNVAGRYAVTNDVSALPYWLCMEKIVAGKKTVKVKFLSGGSGGSVSSNSVLCKITGGSGTNYTVDLYSNGPDKPATGIAYLQVVNVHIYDQIPSGQWIVANLVAITVINGN